MSTVEEIQVDIAQAKEVVELADALERLYKNPDFQKVIQEDLFKAEAARLVGLRANPNIQGNPQILAGIERSMTMIGELQQHFHKIYVMAGQAEEAIRQGNLEIEALTEEGEF